MKNRNVLRRSSVSLPLIVSATLLAAAGCGDDTVRGAGSIHVPRPASRAIPEKATTRPGETAVAPAHAR